MDIDSLKKSWNEMQLEIERVNTLNKQLTEKLCISKACTLTTRLKRRFLYMAIGCFISSFYAIPMDEILHTGSGFAICFALYFIILGVLNIILLYKVCRIDLGIMTVRGALESTIALQITRLRFRRIGYVMMVPMLLVMLYYIYIEDIAILFGGVLGGALGGFIGYRLDRNIERHINELKEILARELSESES